MDMETLEKRPGIIMVGSPGVGKRTLLSRLFPVDFEDAPNPSSKLLAYGWTINTKYYTADVSVWMAHLHDKFSVASLPMFDKLSALVMVFDVNDLSSFAALKDWVKQTDIQKFDILLCIGNKVDLLLGHPAHMEYRRCLLKCEESSGSSHQYFADYGISETEGSSLLGDEEPSSEITKSCLEWCIEHNIEYIEACASNAEFDKCLSVDDDSQGVERLYGALTAHTWPGMSLKSGDKINEPSLPELEDLSEEESEYELEYDVLISGSAELWDTTDGWMSADGPVSTTGTGEPCNLDSENFDRKNEVRSGGEEHEPLTSASQLQEELDRDETPTAHEAERTSKPDDGKTYDFEDLEMLISEIGNMRSSLRLMPDFQRREIAAKLAMKMAAMFGDSSGGEEGY
ncbi:GTP binding [Abeliophyllum distichum]|uniref:GTP binding n=1 Tax=Abeliophyllum distichum TaxID=126358 RepID=A0ABD1W043_9LAMI